MQPMAYELAFQPDTPMSDILLALLHYKVPKEIFKYFCTTLNLVVIQSMSSHSSINNCGLRSRSHLRHAFHTQCMLS